MTEEQKRQSLYRHPLAAVGGALFAAGAFAFVVLLLIDFTSHSDNPYTGLVTFIGAPALITLGLMLFIIAVFLQVHSARKRGDKVKFSLSIDPADPKYMRNLWVFLGLSVVLIAVVAYSGSRAYEATDSTAFCGKTCHEVMEPQYVTYQNSPHARVLCVDCHIGPGASFYVKSKVDGLRQVLAVTFNSFSRPIETPVHSLRPAQETCERCHWPRQFYGEKLVTKTYYRTDEQNSPWTVSLLVKIGGGNPRTGKLEGIHWHMIGDNVVEYISTDKKRQNIPWIRVTNSKGDTAIYADPGATPPDLADTTVELRRFDCMDCHNRPSHRFQPAATAVNLALSTGQIPSDLPYVRKVGLELLNATYEKREDAYIAITKGLTDYYRTNYAQLADTRIDDIKKTGNALIQIYKENFFPEMKTDYRARENNLSHFTNDGCFRCHDGVKVNQWGEKLSHDCNTCHSIVAQGASMDVDKLENRISGLEFKHPEDIEDAWKEAKCTECHTPDQGY